MTATYMTTADVLKFSLGVDPAVGIVSNVLNDAPLLRALAARSRAGFTFRFPRKTSDPVVGFRVANDGRENSTATYEQVTVTAEILDASNSIDVAVAQADEFGVDHACSQSSMDHLAAALFAAEKQIIYGGDALGFSGFADLATVDGTASDMVVDAGGTTVGGASSVWLIRTGIQNCQVVWGADGIISVGDRTIIEKAGATTGTYPAFYTPITAWCALQTATCYDVARIANLTTQSGKGLTDDLIVEAIAKFPASRGPNIIAMNRRSWAQLQQSRTATTTSGKPADLPKDSFDIPIIVTDSIISTENILDVTG